MHTFRFADDAPHADGVHRLAQLSGDHGQRVPIDASENAASKLAHSRSAKLLESGRVDPSTSTRAALDNHHLMARRLRPRGSEAAPAGARSAKGNAPAAAEQQRALPGLPRR